MSPDLDQLTVPDPFKQKVRDHYERLASLRDLWYRRNSYYHHFVEERLGELVPPGWSVIELGSGTGNLLNALKPSRGLGLDISPAMVKLARVKFPHLQFEVADAENFELPEKFDFVVASDLIGELGDIAAMLERVHQISHDATRLIVTFHSPAMEGVLRMAQRAKLAMPPFRQNWVAMDTTASMLALADFAIKREEHSLLIPVSLPIITPAVNRLFSERRAFKYFDLLNIVVAEPIVPRPAPRPLSCSVIVPCRNEVGNI